MVKVMSTQTIPRGRFSAEPLQPSAPVARGNQAAIERDSSQPQFWNQRWEDGKTPWDLGGVPPALESFLSRMQAPTRVLIPGCGSGYELRAFHEAGHEVIGLEFSAPAVARARELLGPLGNKVVHGDFFRHDFDGRRFGWIYERGFREETRAKTLGRQSGLFTFADLRRSPSATS